MGSVERENRVSVVMPCYNSADTLSDQLAALNNQSYEGEWELIIADNGSTDATLKIADQFSKKQMINLKIIDASDIKGAAHARNRGVDQAKSEFILFCDSDDVVGETWMEEMVGALEIYDLAAPRFEHSTLSEKRFAVLNNFQTDGLIDNKFSPHLPHAGASGLAVRKEVHRQIGGFDESFLAAQDWDYCWKAQLAGFKLKFVSAAIVHVRHRGTLRTWAKQAYFWGTYYALIVKKYKPYGINPPSLDKVVNKWKKLIVNLPRIRNQRFRDRLVWEIFHTLGKIKGSIKFKTFVV